MIGRGLCGRVDCAVLDSSLRPSRLWEAGDLIIVSLLASPVPGTKKPSLNV